MTVPEIVLASTSPHRRKLLARLLDDFQIASPQTDETEVIGESPDARALRLAEEKARDRAADYPRALIIGGDQTVSGDGRIFDKPGNAENAARQLRQMSGKCVQLFTAVAVFDARKNTMQSRLISHRAQLRRLSDDEIRRYIEKENALNCAGGVQIEGLGIALLESVSGGDPSAVVGMPLAALAAMLRAGGVQIP